MESNEALKVTRRVEAVAHGLLSIVEGTREAEARFSPGVLSCHEAQCVPWQRDLTGLVWIITNIGPTRGWP